MENEIGLPHDNQPSNEVDDLEQSLLYNDIFGKIKAALGAMSSNNNRSTKCPLFTTTIDDLEINFTSVLSGVEADNPSGVSPSFLKISG